MLILKRYRTGFSWNLVPTDEVYKCSLGLGLCSVDPSSHYIKNIDRLEFFVLTSPSGLELGAVGFHDNLIVVHRSGGFVPSRSQTPYVLDFLNSFSYKALDTEPSIPFSFMGIFRYKNEWLCALDCADKVFDTDLNWNNLRIKDIPEGITVNGNFSLRNTGISSIPESLKVSGTLDVRNNKLTHSINSPMVIHD